MSLNQRRILYTIFILAFLIIAPLVSLYATGYKVGDGFRIQKTGILIIDSEPEGAAIYLNGQVQQKFINRFLGQRTGRISTPAKIKNLLPGEYEIRVDKEGYWPWQKKLEIKPGESTFAEDITLFKNDIPMLVAGGGFSFLDFGSRQEKLFFGGENSLKTIDLQSLEISTLSPVPTTTMISKISHNSSGEYILAGRRIIKNSGGETIDLGEYLGSEINLIRWDEEREDLVWYQGQGGLNSYDIKANLVSRHLNIGEAQDILPRSDYVYILENNDRNTSLHYYRPGDKAAERTLSLPLSDYAFLPAPPSRLSVLDKRHNTLYLFKPDSPLRPLSDTIPNLKIAEWISGRVMLYANDFEIWLYRADQNNRSLLTRISRPINSLAWHPSNNYVIYATDGSISTLELDDREKYNITELLKINRVSDLQIDRQGRTLYFLGRINQQQGVFKLNIR